MSTLNNPLTSTYELKRSFLLSQIRELSAELRPARDWQDVALPGPEGDLREGVVEGMLVKLNTLHRKHSNLVYSTQALRHVCEQLDALYFDPNNNTTTTIAGTDEDANHPLRTTSTLTDPTTISLLPPTFPTNPPLPPNHPLQEQYSTLHAKLVAQQDTLTAYRRKREYLLKLKKMVEVFRQPVERVQGNLVTRERDGGVGGELERMRGLAVRLSVQIERAGLRGGGGGRVGGDGDKEGEGGKKVEERLVGLLGGS